MRKSEQVYQPRLSDVNWGSVYEVERTLSGHGDIFLRFGSYGRMDVMPIKYSLEGRISTALGIIATLGGRMSSEAFRAGMQIIGDEDDMDIASCVRMVREVFDEEVPLNYRENWWTYQGDMSVRYEPGDGYFEFACEKHDERKDLLVDLSMIPVIAQTISAGHDQLSEEYLMIPNKISGLISQLWYK